MSGDHKMINKKEKANVLLCISVICLVGTFAIPFVSIFANLVFSYFKIDLNIGYYYFSMIIYVVGFVISLINFLIDKNTNNIRGVFFAYIILFCVPLIGYLLITLFIRLFIQLLG